MDGGIRALHPTLFAESLRLTWIRRLLDPTPQVWKNLMWEHLNDTYGQFNQGELLLTSSLDFSQLPDTVPPFFRHMMNDWGRLCTPTRDSVNPYSTTPLPGKMKHTHPIFFAHTAGQRVITHQNCESNSGP